MDVHAVTNAQVALLAAVEVFSDNKYASGRDITIMADSFLTWLDRKSQG